RGGRSRRKPGGGDRVPGHLRVQLCVHAGPAGNPSGNHDDRQMSAQPRSVIGEIIETPRGWLVSSGLIVKFAAGVVRDVFNLRVFRFAGEALRQAGILMVSSTLVLWGLVFIIGLQCGIEGAYLLRAQ